MAEIAVRQSWDKRPGESQVAFASFAVYRDMPPPRSIEKTATITGKSPGTLQGHSQKYGWVERAAAFDLWQDQERQKRRQEEIARAEEAELGAARALEGVVIANLAGRPAAMDERGRTQEEIRPLSMRGELDSNEIVRALEVAVKIRRLTHGQPTDLSKALDNFTLREMTEALNMFVDVTIETLGEHVPDEAWDVWWTRLKQIGAGGRPRPAVPLNS